jgi:hypothetical protein
MNTIRMSVWLGLSSCALACSGGADIPGTPDLSALRARYDKPSASLDDTTVGETLAMAPPLATLAAGFRSTEFATGGVDDASQAAAGPSGSGVRLQGGIQITLRCPGEGDKPVFDAKTNGTISLTLAVAQNRIHRTVGGAARKCVLLGTLAGVSIPVELDGDLAFDLGHDLGIGARWSGELLASIEGEITVGGVAFRKVTARKTKTSFEHLFELPDGTTVVLELTDSGVRLRDRGGAWFCLDPDQCTHE